MSWLFDYEDIAELIQEEVNMYLWHRRKVNGQPNLGWLRSAFFSQIQQIVRQDPVYYALVVATNPQKNWRQISFPYYMKAVLPGDYIYFLHLDLNIPRYMECGRGANWIQTSLSFSQEHKDECTHVIPGFHTKIQEWWTDVNQRMEDKTTTAANRIKDHRGNCMKTSDIYTKRDKERYGEPVPVICSPGDVRISRPKIMHGSGSSKTDGIAKRNRIVVNLWFVGIQADHSTLDMPESGSWEFLSACHRDLLATKGTPSGQINIHGLPPSPFPASIPVRNLCAIGDALVGQCKWNDSIVIWERDLLFGDDETIAWGYVEHFQKKAVETYRENMKYIRILEEEAYGANSYYRLKREGKNVNILSENDDVGIEILNEMEIEG